MAIKTVRFNKKEERLLRKILAYYKGDFSNCVKQLLVEKFEDLSDLSVIRKIREDKKENYFSAGNIDKLFPN